MPGATRLHELQRLRESGVVARLLWSSNYERDRSPSVPTWGGVVIAGHAHGAILDEVTTDARCKSPDGLEHEGLSFHQSPGERRVTLDEEILRDPGFVCTEDRVCAESTPIHLRRRHPWMRRIVSQVD